MACAVEQDPRRLAYDVLLRVADGAYSDLALDAALSRSSLTERDRRLATELVYGLLRRRGRLDFALQIFSQRPLERLQSGVLWLLRLGAYQILETDRIPSHAAVNSTVQLARAADLERAAGFINAVLRALQRGKADIPWPQPKTIKPYLEHVCSLPAWLAKEMMALLPNSEAQALGEELIRQPPLSLRVNALKIEPAAFLEALGQAGHRGRHCRFAGEGVMIEQRGAEPLPGDAEGWYQVQDEASMLVARLLDARPGQRILDACAAPGGKTTHLAALTENKAEIIALDKYPARVELIQQGVQRLGCAHVDSRSWDLAVPPTFLEAQSFDRILVDAPCSGLGVLRRSPEGRWNKTAANLRQLASLQRQILDNVAALLKPGGRLLYAVCTFSRAETDALVTAFLQAHPEYRLDSLVQDLAANDGGELLTEQGTVRTYPQRHERMDAFFAARFVRMEE